LIFCDALLPRPCRRLPTKVLRAAGRANSDDIALAHTSFQQAVDLDSTFAGGYRGLDWTELLEANVFFGTRNLADAQTSSEALARRAVALDGTDAEARALLSAALLRRGDHLGAKAEAEDA